jgi:hypothetical protein
MTSRSFEAVCKAMPFQDFCAILICLLLSRGHHPRLCLMGRCGMYLEKLEVFSKTPPHVTRLRNMVVGHGCTQDGLSTLLVFIRSESVRQQSGEKGKPSPFDWIFLKSRMLPESMCACVMNGLRFLSTPRR